MKTTTENGRRLARWLVSSIGSDETVAVRRMLQTYLGVHLSLAKLLDLLTEDNAMAGQTVASTFVPVGREARIMEAQQFVRLGQMLTDAGLTIGVAAQNELDRLRSETVESLDPAALKPLTNPEEDADG